MDGRGTNGRRAKWFGSVRALRLSCPRTTSSGTPDARTPRLKRPRQADANEKLSIALSCDQGNQRLIDT